MQKKNIFNTYSELFLFSEKERKKKIIKVTGKKIPRILCEVLKAANIENIKKFL